MRVRVQGNRESELQYTAEMGSLLQLGTALRHWILRSLLGNVPAMDRSSVSPGVGGHTHTTPPQAAE